MCIASTVGRAARNDLADLTVVQIPFNLNRYSSHRADEPPVVHLKQPGDFQPDGNAGFVQVLFDIATRKPIRPHSRRRGP
jgi:hypothetical protein